MGNMSYCRMRNTERDLRDCLENWEASYDDDGNEYELSEDEYQAKLGIIKLAKRILDLEEY